MIELQTETASWRTFLTALAGGLLVILLYAGLLAIGFSRVAHVVQPIA